MTIRALTSRAHPGLVVFAGERCAHRFARHVHDGAYSVGFVRAGRSAFQNGAGRYGLGPGQLCAFAPGTPHDGGPDGAEPWDFVTIHVPLSLAGVMPHASTLADDGAPREDAGAVRLARALETAIGDHDAGAERDLGRALIRRLYPDAAPVAPIEREPEAGTGDDTVGALAMRAGVHRCTFSRRFRAERGIDARRYLLARRIERAASLILAGTRLADAAAAAGFADQSHMTRAMRAILGVAPGALGRRR